MPMPVPGETANQKLPVEPIKEQEKNTPVKNNQQMLKSENTPSKQQPAMANSNQVKANPSPVNTQTKSAGNLNNNNNTPKKDNKPNMPNQQQNKNGQNKNQNNGNNNNNNNNNNKNGNNQQSNNNNNNQKNNNQNNQMKNSGQQNNQMKNNGQQNNQMKNNGQQNNQNKNKFNLNNNKPHFDKARFHSNNEHKQGNTGNKFQKHNGNNDNSYSNKTLESKDQTPAAEKRFTGRCRLFCGNLPSDMTEEEFKDLFKKFGETGECFLNTARSFGFIKLDTRINAEHAKQEMDGMTFKGRTIRVRFATHGAAVKVKNLSPYISNEYLEQAFSMFGPVERAVVIVDDKGRPTGEGIVEFERKPASIQCINKCQENCFILTSYPKPIVVEPLEQKDEEDGLPEKSIIKNAQFYMEREAPAHFAAHNSNEHKLAIKWRELYELEKQITEEGKRRIDQAREMLEFEIEQALIENKRMQLKEDLRMKQEELDRIEVMRNGEMNRRQDMEMRRMDEERLRQDQMMMMGKQDGLINNPRIGNNNNQGRFEQGRFEQPLLNQPNQGGLAQGAMQQQQQGNNSRRGGNQNNNNFNNNQFNMDQNELNNLPPAQQQALIAAQLSFAMAAAAQQGNMGNNMFDNNGQQMPNNNFNNNSHNSGHNGGHNGGGQKHKEDRGGNSGPRRQFDRRGGNNNRGNNRDDSYPGFDTKRPRF